MSIKRIEFFLFPGANSLDVSGPLEVFSVASNILFGSGSSGGYKVVFTSESPGPIELESGLRVFAETRLEGSEKSDYLIIPGGGQPEKFSDSEARLSYLSKRALLSNKVVSICTGAFILARLGLLDGKRCTTHWRYADQLAENYSKINVNKNAIYIEDGRVYTSAGVTAGIDLALALLEQDFGSELAMETARNLVLYLRRPGNQSQFSAPMELQKKAGQRFSSLHDWLQENLDRESLQVEELAECMSMSPRNFSRSFKLQTGMSPAKYVEVLRLEKAREILSHSDVPVKSVALDCGFQHEERLRRLFIKYLGITPTQYRSHFSALN